MSEVKHTKTAEQAMSALMHLCARSERSSGDALRLMYRWGIASKERDAVLERLIRERYIDDGRFAAAYVRDKLKFSRWGEHKIRAALRAKGIDNKVIDSALSQERLGDPNERLERSLVFKLQRVSGTPYEIKGKLMRYGLSLGYDYETVYEAVERCIKQ